MAKIKGNQDGKNGRNETYRVASRPNVPRKQLVKEVEIGLHPNVHIYKIGREKFVRDNRDVSKRDNVNS